jgi:hypothetical protein
MMDTPKKMVAKRNRQQKGRREIESVHTRDLGHSIREDLERQRQDRVKALENSEKRGKIR